MLVLVITSANQHRHCGRILRRPGIQATARQESRTLEETVHCGIDHVRAKAQGRRQRRRSLPGRPRIALPSRPEHAGQKSGGQEDRQELYRKRMATGDKILEQFAEQLPAFLDELSRWGISPGFSEHGKKARYLRLSAWRLPEQLPKSNRFQPVVCERAARYYHGSKKFSRPEKKRAQFQIGCIICCFAFPTVEQNRVGCVLGRWLHNRPCLGGTRTRSVLACIPARSVETRRSRIAEPRTKPAFLFFPSMTTRRFDKG